jgi:hypothetical protein
MAALVDLALLDTTKARSSKINSKAGEKSGAGKAPQSSQELK